MLRCGVIVHNQTNGLVRSYLINVRLWRIGGILFLGEEEEGIVIIGSEGLLVYAPFHVAGGVDDSVYEESDRSGWLCGRGYGVVGYCLIQGILIRRNVSVFSLSCSLGKDSRCCMRQYHYSTTAGLLAAW